MTRFRFSVIALLATACGSAASLAQAQYFGRGPGIVVRAPYVGSIRVGVGPIVPRIVGAAPVIPRVVGVPGVPLVRPILPRRRISVPAGGAAAGAAYGGGPTVAPRYAPGRTRAVVGANPNAAPRQIESRPFPTADELAALDDGSLLNAVLESMAQLDDDVAQFDTGDTWQRYFRLPDDALPPPTADGHVTLGFPSIKATLARLDSVAANPKYPMIAGLPSFAAARTSLTEVVHRFGAAAGDGSVANSRPRGEELPAPPPAAAAAPAAALVSPPSNADGEHSILSR
jgi:hypothetical protein